MYDLAIINGTIVSDGRRTPSDIGIMGGVIAEVGARGSIGPAHTTIDTSGKYVLPGAIDIHFHCRAPSHPERGDFTSETRAAAAGGVTTIFEMPISDPACSTPAVLDSRRSAAEGRCYVHYALYGGGGHGDPARAQLLADAGAIGFKIFTTTPPPQRLMEFDGLTAVTEAAIYTALQGIAPTGLPTVFHAENQSLINLFARIVINGIPQRPPVVEAAEIALLGILARAVGTRVHIAHLTSAAGLEATRSARKMGAPLTAETCPQYLLFDQSAVERWGAFVKIAPPLRDRSDVDALWEGIREGTISVVASDHAPFTPEEKRDVEYANAPQGMPSVETMVPVLLDAAARGLLPLEQAVDLLTSAPARLFGIHGRKGTVSEGADADLVIFEPDRDTIVYSEDLFTKAAGCAVAYDGMPLRGRIDQTFLMGQPVFRNGEIVGQPRGCFVRPTVRH